MNLPPISRWAVWPLICAAVLTLSVVRGDIAELYGGDYRALWDGSIAQRHERVIVEPDYVLTGPRQPLPVDTRLASLDSLGGPRVLPPPLCGRYAVPGIWRATPGWTFTGQLWDGRLYPQNCECTSGCIVLRGVTQNACSGETCTFACDEGTYTCADLHCEAHDLGPAGPLSIRFADGDSPGYATGWHAWLGDNDWTGPLTVADRRLATVAAPASEIWRVDDGSLLCLDGDLVADLDHDHSLSGAATITYDDGTGVVWVDGQLTVGAGAEITVEQAPPYYPITLLEARGGLSGTFSAGSLPPDWVLLQDTHFVRLDYQP